MKTKSTQSMSDTLKQLHKSLEAKRDKLKQQVEDCEKAITETRDAFRLLSPYKRGDVLRVIYESNRDNSKAQRGQTVKIDEIYVFNGYGHELPNVTDYIYSLVEENGSTVNRDTSWKIVEVIKLPL